MSLLSLDAEALYKELLRGVRGLCKPQTRLVGITSGGAWLAERLQRDLGLPGEPGQVSSVMHRDDYAQRGLSAGGQTQLPFEVDGADICVPASSGGNCGAALACRSTKSTSGTPRPRRMRWAPKTPMPLRQRSFLNSF